MAKPSGSAKGGKGKSNEEIYAGFQSLRAEQRQLANKISELEMDLNEHKIVIETLEGVEGSRRCFRMVGGVIVEREAATVLEELKATRDRLPSAISALQEQLTKVGTQINEYIEQHDIRLHKPDARPDADAHEQPAKANVLVASS